MIRRLIARAGRALSGRTMRGYRVDIEGHGRSGTVRYSEGDQSLALWWEFTGDGTAIKVPSPERWDASYEDDAAWAKGRREEILQPIGSETRRQRARSAKVQIEDEWITLTF